MSAILGQSFHASATPNIHRQNSVFLILALISVIGVAAHN